MLDIERDVKLRATCFAKSMLLKEKNTSAHHTRCYVCEKRKKVKSVEARLLFRVKKNCIRQHVLISMSESECSDIDAEKTQSICWQGMIHGEEWEFD